MKKFFLVGAIFLLCGCGDTVSKSVEDVSSNKYALAKNNIWGYVKAVELAYTEYQYSTITGNYEVLDNSTLVNIDGVPTQLNVKAYGEDVSCGSVSIVEGHAKLDDCSVYGYSFSFDGDVIDK